MAKTRFELSVQGREPRVNGREPRVKGREPRVKGREPRVKGREPRVNSREASVKDCNQLLISHQITVPRLNGAVKKLSPA